MNDKKQVELTSNQLFLEDRWMNRRCEMEGTLSGKAIIGVLPEAMKREK